MIPGLELYRYPSHGVDMLHLFKSLLHESLFSVSEETKNVVEVMVTTFTNFAATGDPSSRELGINWPPVVSEDELLMGLNIHETESKVMVLPESRRTKVFAQIWDTERPENASNK
jgi:carboxylesterase type B